ncbi:MAG TPA: cation diffusion facilitator family transporter [Casimicrobiaceae bacterium]|nr:cation diffusion facilitator family transporter [Casimicrobiaceae bacterium]
MGTPHGHAHAHAAHDHPAHDHGAHDHASAPLRALSIAFALTAAFAVVEAVGGVLAHSLALLSDAGHMITDAAALAAAIFAQKLAQRPPSPRASYGYARAEVLAAFINALVMLLIVAGIVFEAVQRLAHPAPVAGGLLLVIAAVGLGVNIAAAWTLTRAQSSVNLRAALLHVVGDLLGSVAAIAAGVVIATTGWMPIDPILSIAISLLILRSTWRLLRQTSAVLMEGVPPHLDYAEIGRELSRLPGVSNVHDLHVWHMGSEDVALSAHVAIGEARDWPRTLGAAQRMLRERFGITHVTLQPDWVVNAPAGRKVIPVKARE